MGCSEEKSLQNDHRVRNRVKWSSRELSRRLLVVLVHPGVPANEPVILGIDEMIERRRGRTMAARGVSRDLVRSSQGLLAKTPGLRWMYLMLWTPSPWACRVWAPSERSPEERNRRHTTITNGAWQMIRHVVRWMPGRRLVVVADGTSAVLEFCSTSVACHWCAPSHACVWMPVRPIRPPCGKPEDTVDRPSKGKHNLRWLRASPSRQRHGRNKRWPGLREPRERWRSPRARLCGSMLSSPRRHPLGAHS